MLNICIIGDPHFKISNIQNVDLFTFYWLTMTILTMIWECSFIYNYEEISVNSNYFIENDISVWTYKNYDLSYTIPWKLAPIYYADYGAWADREYMTLTDDWSRIIEGSHELFCGLFSFLALYYKANKHNNESLMALSIGMGTQLMNSILYMSEYIIQSKIPSNVNCDNHNFPCGKYFIKRPFMYVNIFWTLMPSYILTYYMFQNSIY